MNNNNHYREQLTAFFLQYVNANTKAFENGLLNDSAIKESAELLLKEKVFISIKDMKKEALKDYNIILADWIFEYLKK